MWIAAPPSTPGIHTPPAPNGSGGAWIALMIWGILIWGVFQLTPGGRRKWTYRWGLVAPLLSVVASDISFLLVRPIVTRYSAYRFRKQLGDL